MEPEDVIQHTSSEFARFLKNVRSHTLEMGGLAEQHVSSAVQAFLDGNQKLAKKIAREDFKINALEVKIDEECSEFLALQHPVAMDLRTVIAVIKATTDLERVGDEAEKIGRHAVKLAAVERSPTYFMELRHLGDQVCKMLHDCLDALARMDIESALAIAEGDRAINDEYDSLTRQLITHMMEDPRTIKRSLRVMWCARSLERIGDHAKNICEYVIYTVAGKDIRHTSFDQVKAELGDINDN